MLKRRVVSIILFIATGAYMVSCQNPGNVEMIENSPIAAEETVKQDAEITVEEQYHSRDEACGASFPMWGVEKDGIRYGFKQSAFTEKEAAGYVRKMEEYIDAVKLQMQDVDSFPRNIELQILVLDDISTIDLSQSKKVLILTKDELENEQYGFWLFLSVSQLSENSRNFGAYTYISGMDYDNERIKEYLSEEENRRTLDLFYARRSEVYADREDAEMFEQILASIAAEKIEESGLNGYLKEPFSKSTINDWLDKIGLEESYENDDLDYVDQMIFKRDSHYDLHIECGNVSYLIEACTSAFESASELEEFIVTEMKTRAAMEEYLKANHVTSPMFDTGHQLSYEILGDKATNSYWEFIGSNSSCIHIYGNYKGIFQEVMTHELTHAFVGVAEDRMAWMNEGFAEYLSRVIFPQPSRKEMFYAAIEKAASDADCLWRTNYIAMEGVPEDIEDFDMLSFLDGNVVAYWDGDKTLEGVPQLELKLWEQVVIEKSENGAELSYWEAESFVAYLIERSSFETTWNCMVNNLDYEEVYGKTYDELKTEWIQDIRGKALSSL